VPVPDVEGFLRATASNVDVVVDWGIPASAVNWASTLIQTYGLEAWWFDGERAVAKRRFDARRDLGEHIATEADHTRYLNGVTLGWDEYGVLFGDRVLDTLSSDDIFPSGRTGHGDDRGLSALTNYGWIETQLESHSFSYSSGGWDTPVRAVLGDFCGDDDGILGRALCRW
jgi:hypothetical protein